MSEISTSGYGVEPGELLMGEEPDPPDWGGGVLVINLAIASLTRREIDGEVSKSVDDSLN